MTIWLLAVIGCGGCAIQYFDMTTQTEHLWGVGHFRMKVAPPAEGVQAAVKGVSVAGVSLKIGSDDSHLVIGWNETSRLIVAGEGASVRLEWPTSDPFTIRVGSRPPFLPDDVGAGTTRRGSAEGGGS